MRKTNPQKLYFWFQILFVPVFMCPFSNYEEGLISSINPVSEENKLLVLQSSSGDALSFGFWSFCIPLWEVNKYPPIISEFDINNPEYGQLLFLVKPIDNIEPIILGYVWFDSVTLKVIHNIAVEIPQTNFDEFSFPYQSNNYEGKWIFTLLSFLPQINTLIIQMTDQIQQTIVTDLSGLSEISFIIGGRGLINMNSNDYNLNIFRGRLSKLIIEPQYTFYYDKFIELQTKCQIPQKIIGEQKIDIVLIYQHIQLYLVQDNLMEMDYYNLLLIKLEIDIVYLDGLNMMHHKQFIKQTIRLLEFQHLRIIKKRQILVMIYFIFQFRYRDNLNGQHQFQPIQILILQIIKIINLYPYLRKVRL